MDELVWELLHEVYGRMEAETIKSYLEAHDIRVELFQESVGHLAIPVTIDGLGKVQIFAPKKQIKEAREWLKVYTEGQK